MQLAHISDLHVADFESVTLRDFLNKRVTGGINLLTGRRGAHPLDLCERLVEDLTGQDLDHVVVTGDVTNLSLPGEFQRAARLLRPLGGYERLTVVPGNHDVYTAGAETQHRFESYFGYLLFGAESQPADWVYPAVKDLGDTVIVGLSSAHKTPMFTAWGWVGEDQLGRLEQRLAEVPHLERKTKVALVHHNLHPRDAWHEHAAQLKDRTEVIAALHRLRFDLLLHGHTHRAHQFVVERDGHTLAIVGSGSSTRQSEDPGRIARYNVYSTEGSRVRLRTRVYVPSQRKFDWMP